MAAAKQSGTSTLPNGLEMNAKRLAYRQALRSFDFGRNATLTEAQIRQVSSERNLGIPYWILKDHFRIQRGLYHNPFEMKTVPVEAIEARKVNKGRRGGVRASKATRGSAPKRGAKGVRGTSTSAVLSAAGAALPAPAAVDSPVEKPSLVVPAAAASDANVIDVAPTDGVDAATGESYVPNVDPTFVPWGHYSDIETIIQARIFYPIFFTGLSGNGKTMTVEQACAATGREMIRVNITIETNEDDLIGGFRLENGRTVWQDGPVVVAMKRGAILLLDEIDLASNKILILQPVLEGKGIFLKKIGVKVEPKAGFQVIATANTKGQGSDTGEFVGTNVLNEAFLERFAITLEQDYPEKGVEKRILRNISTLNGVLDTEFIGHLVDWANVTRVSYSQGTLAKFITTRRLAHIINAFAIFKSRRKAITMAVSRYDTETKTTIIDAYTKMDINVDKPWVDPNDPIAVARLAAEEKAKADAAAAAAVAAIRNLPPNNPAFQGGSTSSSSSNVPQDPNAAPGSPQWPW